MAHRLQVAAFGTADLAAVDDEPAVQVGRAKLDGEAGIPMEIPISEASPKGSALRTEVNRRNRRRPPVRCQALAQRTSKAPVAVAIIEAVLSGAWLMRPVYGNICVDVRKFIQGSPNVL